MGAGQSSEIDETSDPLSFTPQPHREREQDEVVDGCFHVLKVDVGSPAAEQLQPFLDYILAVNGRRLDQPSHTLVHELEQNIGRPVQLEVYRAPLRRAITVNIVPERWGGPGLLGATLRFCRHTNAMQHVWGILVWENNIHEVQPDSPADKMELKASTDFIIGARGAMLGSVRTLDAYLQDHVSRAVVLYVYDVLSQTTRQVPIIPDSAFEMNIGCKLDYGPARLYEASQAGESNTRPSGDSETPQKGAPALPNQEVVAVTSEQNDDESFGTRSRGEAPKQRPSVGDGNDSWRHLGAAHTVPVQSTPPLQRRKVTAEQSKQDVPRMILIDDTSVEFL